MQYVKDQDTDEFLQNNSLTLNLTTISFFTPDFKTYPKLQYVEGSLFILQEGCIFENKNFSSTQKGFLGVW
jgi:hypothetical protein